MPRRSSRLAAREVKAAGGKAEVDAPLLPDTASDDNPRPQTPTRRQRTARRRDQFTLSPQGEDALGLVSTVRETNPHYLSPSSLDKEGDAYRTRTPGRRLFKPLMQFAARARGIGSRYRVLQADTYKEREIKYPPVVHDDVAPVTPPRIPAKSVTGFVRPSDIKNLRRERRKGTSTFYHGNSANDMGPDDGHRRVHSHLAPVKQIGERGRDGIVVATEGQNVTQSAVENAAASTILNPRFDAEGLECKGEATLALDSDNKATHLGVSQTLTYSSPGDSRSVKADFDSRNPNAARAGVRQLFSRSVFPGLFHSHPPVNRTLFQDDAAAASSETDIPVLG